VGHRIAEIRRRRSASSSSGTLIRNGRMVGSAATDIVVSAIAVSSRLVASVGRIKRRRGKAAA
jgi:hypothetical protein